MDFITHLPPSPQGNDTITVFVDRLTKMVHLHAGKATDDAPTIAQQFLQAVFCPHGLPDTIVSDRDPHFMSHFWTAFHKALGTTLSHSSAYHPQTDSQTE